MKVLGLIALFVVLIGSAFYFKAWQCEQMFPNASLLACIFWK